MVRGKVGVERVDAEFVKREGNERDGERAIGDIELDISIR